MSKRINIWDERVTIHPTLPERINTTLVELCHDEYAGMRKSKLVEQLITQSDIVQKKLQELEAEGRFK